MNYIELFKPGEKITAKKLNKIIEQIKVLQQIEGGQGILIHKTASGIYISQIEHILTTDDKYKLDEKYNQSDIVRRLGDLKEGDIADQWRIRATTQVDPKDEDEVLYKIHLLLNRLDSGGEGGWVTDAARTGLSKTKHSPEHEVPTPKGRTGQLGDVLILDNGDLIAITKDQDRFVLLNIRHDAHFLYDEDHDGRLYLTTTTPGIEPTGPPVIGEIVCDPAKINADTRLGKESGEWRPQLKDTYPPDMLIYPSNSDVYDFPSFTRMPTPGMGVYSAKAAAVFPHTTKKGWAADIQLPNKYTSSWNLGIYIEYSTPIVMDGPDYACFKLKYVVISEGDDFTIVTTTRELLIPNGNGDSEQTIYKTPIIPAAELSPGDTVVIQDFYRDIDDADDDLLDQVLINGFKLYWTTEAIIGVE